MTATAQCAQGAVLMWTALETFAAAAVAHLRHSARIQECQERTQLESGGFNMMGLESGVNGLPYKENGSTIIQ
eukprot:3873431-Amphidinium_carterae.2